MRRRNFIGALLASSTLPSLGWADVGSPAFLAAAKEQDGTYALFGLTEAGEDLFRIPLPARGHAAAAHPTAPEAVAFARRPGTFAVVIDCVGGTVAHHLEAPEGRHFYGHGAFIEDGALLCTTENDIATGEGRIGFWSRLDGYRRVGEIASGGIGPHEVIRLPGDVLAVANGGILTHPDKGREKLNLDTMRPNLAYVTRDGVQETVSLAPDLHHDSIRHLASDGETVAFAMQWQGALPDPAPLLGLHKRGSAPILTSADLAEQMAMDGYAGSVAVMGDTVAITSPRGGRVHLFGLDGHFRASARRADVCGVAAGPLGLMATDGLGGVWALDAGGMTPRRRARRAWDNHLVRIA
ncbi:DUF1513 domain-containing protein [Primorskyibacter sp. 2E107]|uniref:DUF1513 domain-containing protein n=1 Tax=Primorskyibacter sp. 2E107 TaxID=3403458 RepID=UPI003AF61CB0